MHFYRVIVATYLEAQANNTDSLRQRASKTMKRTHKDRHRRSSCVYVYLYVSLSSLFLMCAAISFREPTSPPVRLKETIESRVAQEVHLFVFHSILCCLFALPNNYNESIPTSLPIYTVLQFLPRHHCRSDFYYRPVN